jgi:hypothetical protein
MYIKSSSTFTPIKQLFQKLTFNPDINSKPRRIAFIVHKFSILAYQCIEYHRRIATSTPAHLPFPIKKDEIDVIQRLFSLAIPNLPLPIRKVTAPKDLLA